MESSLRLCQFNILAPSARLISPFKTIPWRDRQLAICEELIRLRPDVVCLQEFEFSNEFEGFASLYQEKLGKWFDLFTKKRTRAKKEGLALLVRREVFDDVELQTLELEPTWCDRVAMVARMTHRDSGHRFLVANTHLTVAHATNDHDIPYCRPLQMEQVLKALHMAENVDTAFLCADMNSDHLETEPSGPYDAAVVNKPVEMAFTSGFSSALHDVLPGVRPISHTCSYAHDGCADYVFFQPRDTLQLKSAFLHPRELPPDAPWISEVGWSTDPASTLSDHRPIVVDFKLHRLYSRDPSAGA